MKYLPTGNDYLTLPLVNTERGCVESLNVLFMRLRGLVEVVGDQETGFLEPDLRVDGKRVEPAALEWRRLDYWLPAFQAQVGEVELEGVLCAPIDERGLLWRLRAQNVGRGEHKVSLGLQGRWTETRHRINYTRPVRGVREARLNDWFRQIVLEFRTDVTLLAVTLGADQPLDVLAFSRQPSAFSTSALEELGPDDPPIGFLAGKQVALEPGSEASADFFIGVGLEEMAGCAAVEEQRRKGAEELLETTRAWLQERARSTGEAGLDEPLNLNLFFNYFYAQGRTLDTEQRVFVTSRSPRYYVSASYWDRDSLLWSLPALLLVEPRTAREGLLYAFSVQGRNFGVHSRYIDGVMLESGFELDELCAPVLALGQYFRQTDDWSLLDRIEVQDGLARVERELEARRHPRHALYSTFLSPSDDFEPLPYETYGNVLVWRTLHELATWADRQADAEQAEIYRARAKEVEAAIWEQCVCDTVEQPESTVGGPHSPARMFAWSIDLQGNARRYDEPAGSLRLLPYFGFCSTDEPTYRNTLAWLRSSEYPYAFSGTPFGELGCDHNPHPWMLSLANALLSGEAERARDLLLRCRTDNGIAAEAIDEHTGRSAGGEDFATCAGFLAYAINYAFGRRE